MELTVFDEYINESTNIFGTMSPSDKISKEMDGFIDSMVFSNYFMKNEITYHFEKRAITDQINFTSISVTIPMNYSFWTNNLDTNRYSVHENTLELQCYVGTNSNPNGCIIPGSFLTKQIAAFPFAFFDDSIKDYRNIDNSLFVCGVGSVLKGYNLSFDNDINKTESNFYISNPIRYYNYTFGVLEWNFVDLAVKFGASCQTIDCHGLAYSFQDNQLEQVLLLGQKKFQNHIINLLLQNSTTVEK